ncbi:band-7 like membrane protein [Streptomyces phage Blueeyedbeauty]|uniref:Band-7-like membrane protein n=1 Tax=Streptomyces phage Blueeyedbeauty TaxID=2250336 RepID=A0A345L1U9_9CAUD|nr:band-7 like membrane protein [Streptomyces phage Blueeyedbeauty]AXH49251.1 band-7-like membrane protein [Streptomyces phage Blueeyedbeauty]
MLYIVLASILVIAILILGAMFLFGKNPDNDYGVPVKSIGLVGGIVATVALLLLTFFMSLTTVGARSVGIQTAFGRYQNTLDNGLQLTAPWSSTEEFSTQVQYLDLDSTDGGDDAVSVTFKGGGGGTVSLTPRWSINEDKAEDLWKKYKTFDKVRNQLVNSSAKDSVRVVVSKYTPNDARDGENLRPIADEIQRDLAQSLADDGVNIDSVSIKKITLDARSQASLDKIVEANNNVERAKAERERAKIDAETAKIREQSGQLSEKAAQRFCLEMMNNWDVKKNGPLQAGFVCPGTNSSGYVTTNK